MKLIATRQERWEKLADTRYDFVLTASGYESRATHVAQQLAPMNEGRRVAVGFVDRPILSRSSNDAFFSQNGFELVLSSGSDGSAVRHEILRAVYECRSSVMHILVDFTSMTRVWYGTVLSALREYAENSPARVIITFAYSPSQYAEPQDPGPNLHMGPVSGFSTLSLPNRKTALILGLGYEPERALGLTEYVEAAEVYAFVASPALDERFLNAVLANNDQLIKDLGPEHVLTHPFGDLQATAARLASLVRGLSALDYRVILAPLGPKPFALICFLLATRYPELDVWRVSQGESEPPYDRAPLGPVLSCTAEFVDNGLVAGTESALTDM